LPLVFPRENFASGIGFDLSFNHHSDVFMLFINFRIIAKAPYQVNSSAEASKQAIDDKSWLGLGKEVTFKQEI
jgi:hypothetical protein